MSAAGPDCWQHVGAVISAMLARTYPNHEFEEFTGAPARPADNRVDFTAMDNTIMQLNDLYPSKYLSAADLQGKEVVAVIESIAMEKFDDGAEKPLIRFQGHQKGLVCNKTNAMAIGAIHGDDTDQWIGKPICLFSMMVTFQNKATEAIRVKRVPEPPADNLVPAKAVAAALGEPVVAATTEAVQPAAPSGVPF